MIDLSQTILINNVLQCAIKLYFSVKTDSGKIILIETKGDDRDNSDSELKLKLGKLWESKAGARFKYMMVFDNNPIDGAERLADAINKLRQM